MSSAITGARSCAWRSAFAATAFLRAAPPCPARLSAAAPFGLPSFTPRAFAADSASFVRREIACSSCSAIANAKIIVAPTTGDGRSVIEFDATLD
ncbi:MAG: hypothetical protein ACQEUZ_00980 [Pseudomonadota bacterium]